MDEVAFVIRDDVSIPGGATEIGVLGPLTHTTTLALGETLRHFLDASPTPCPRLRLDLSCCTCIDLDGLLALAVSQQAARAHGGDLRLVHVSPLITHQLRQHNFDTLLDATDQP
jgi:anti-anti-sigma regulatory factor